MAKIPVSKGSLYASALVVPSHDYSFDIQILHSVLQCRHYILVDRVDLVGDISMHKYFSYLQAQDLFRDYPRIRAANPHKFGRLPFGVSYKILGIPCQALVGVSLVVLKHPEEALGEIVVIKVTAWRQELDLFSNFPMAMVERAEHGTTLV